MSTFRRFAFGIVVGAGLLTASAPALAQDQEILVSGKLKIPEGYEPVKTYVKIGDLNLTTPAGLSEMERRVRNAVNSICPMPPASSPKYEEANAKLCRNYAWASARPQMNHAAERASQRTSGQR